MKRYLLDTNTVSHVLKGHPQVIARMTGMSMARLAVSAITEAALHYGLAKRPDALRLQDLVAAFLRRVEVLPWDRACAARYGLLRARLEVQGKTLAPLDLQIAAHAQAINATLVSHDRAFRQCPDLDWEDWVG